jgi:hypothetical protein
LKAKNNTKKAPAINESAGASTKKAISVKGRKNKNEKLDSLCIA